MAELFAELVDSKQGKGKFNVSLLGHPGAGKSNLVWAVAHHLVSENRETVLWASHREFEEEWELRLFEWDAQVGFGRVYELENAPKGLGDILAEDLLKDVNVLILDAPTTAKSETSVDGLAAFGWAGKKNRIGQRRVIHASSLRAYSTDERILGSNNLENTTIRPWTRKDFVDALSNPNLKNKVCATLGLDSESMTAEDVVDAKLYYSGINARWFFNYTIPEIKGFCRGIGDRMPTGLSDMNSNDERERAVNSAFVSTWDDDRRVRLFTSQHLARLLGMDVRNAQHFLELYPLMKGRLGNGAPGEIFEADFLLNLEQSHDIAVAQRYIMGKKAQQVDVVLGKDVSSGKVLAWPTGSLSPLPKNPTKTGEQPMPFTHSQVQNRVPQWFVPEDNNQPFLDFFVLVPLPNDVKWELRALQNTVSRNHRTDTEQLQKVLMGVETAGFVLASTVQVCFVVETTEQSNLGSGIDGTTIRIPKPAQSPKLGTRSGGNPDKELKVEVVRVLFRRTASSP